MNMVLPRWNRAEIRLPKLYKDGTSQAVICYDSTAKPYEHPFIGIFIAKHHGWVAWIEQNKIRTVTHWMNCPKLPAK